MIMSSLTLDFLSIRDDLGDSVAWAMRHTDSDTTPAGWFDLPAEAELDLAAGEVTFPEHMLVVRSRQEVQS